MYTAFIVLEILGIVAFIGSMFIDKENKDATIGGLAISCICFYMGLVCYGFNGRPTALDVYQGKTTLEITYKDGVPIDSVVVFKK
jgi:hypothetical protein